MAVEFEEQEFNQPSQMQASRQGGAVTNLMLKIGLAKSPAQANVVMLIIAVVAIAVSVYLMLPSGSTVPRGVTPIPGQVLPQGGP